MNLRLRMTTPIEAVWADLANHNERPVFRRVDDEHPLDLYAGIDATEGRLLMLVTNEEPPPPPSYDTISISSRRRADGNWALLITLNTKELAIPFARLCQDLIDASRQHHAAGASAIINRLARWRRLLELTRRNLSGQALRGLIGELLILKNTIAPRFGASAAVTAWVGPENAPQDFQVTGTALDVKTITPTATTITISSLEQLDASTPLFLATVLLTPSSKDQDGAFTPQGLVTSIRDAADEATRAEFDFRLAEAGYQHLPEYSNAWYQTSGTRYYQVSPGFPRLTTTSVPLGITAAIYEITIASCAGYAVVEDDLWT
jgi:hypothetical protein